MRKHLTTWVWYEDRLCSLPSSCLLFLSFVCLVGLSALAFGLLGFWEDMAVLLGETDLRSDVIFLESLLMASAALWVLSCCLMALCRRFILARRGL